jgi:hypothetical protein
MLDDIVPRKIQGIVMIVVGILLLLWGAWVAWGGWNRWSALMALDAHRSAQFYGKAQASQLNAEKAAALDTVAATALAPIDPAAGDAGAKLGQLATTVKEGSWAVRQTKAYHQALLGSAVDARGGTGNDLMIETIVETKNASVVPVVPMPSKSGSAPHMATLQSAIEHRLQAAWRLGDRTALRESAGQLAMLDPKHPAAAYCDLISIFGANDNDRKNAHREIVKRTPDEQIRAAVARAAAILYPDRGGVAMSLVPSRLRSGEELVATMLESNQPISRLVDEAIKLGIDSVLEVVAAACLEQNAVDQLKRLTTVGSQEFRKKVITVVATRTGDLKTLTEMGVDIERVKPRVTLIEAGFGFISFHIVDNQGNPPRTSFEIELNDRAIPPADIRRLGSLIWVKSPGAGRLTLKIRMKGVVIYDGEVTR